MWRVEFTPAYDRPAYLLMKSGMSAPRAISCMPLSDALPVREDDHLVTVLDRLKDSLVGRVLVMRGEELAGIITTRDIAFWLERARQVPKQ